LAEEDHEQEVRGEGNCKRCHRPLRAATSRFLGIGMACLGFVVKKKWSGEEVRQLTFSNLWQLADKRTDPRRET
jgi:hypothetical protein